jgi:hypothetical protein
MPRPAHLIVLTLGLVTACSAPEPEGAAEPAASAPSSGEWEVLFDGTDLDAFNQLGDANWTIEGDTVRADSGAGHLVTRDTYSDFDLEAEFFTDVPANSGVFVRCSDAENVSAETCYEFNIFDTRPDQTYRTGAVVNVAAPAAFVHAAGRWNRYELTLDGNHLQAKLNGVDMIDVEDDTHSEGYVTLQYGSGLVMFRNVRIRRH